MKKNKNADGFVHYKRTRKCKGGSITCDYWPPSSPLSRLETRWLVDAIDELDGTGIEAVVNYENEGGRCNHWHVMFRNRVTGDCDVAVANGTYFEALGAINGANVACAMLNKRNEENK